jgi:SAM-dependent methyltransferase
MDNVLEHLPDTVRTMEELHRVMAPGAQATIIVPYYNSYGAATDPTHVRVFSEDSLNYFTADGYTPHSRFNYYSRARFRILKRKLRHRHRLLAALPERLQLFLGHHLATIEALEWKIEAL